MAVPLWQVLLLAFKQMAYGEYTRFAQPDVLEPAPDNLQYAFIMFRHGIRSPLHDLSEEQTRDYDKTWPEGRGMLTDVGKRELLHVGQSLRTRYQSFTPHQDSRVLVTSTKVDRVVDSATLLAAGMFTPVASTTSHDVEHILSQRQVPVLQESSFDKYSIFFEKAAESSCPSFVAVRDALWDDIDKHHPPPLTAFYRRLEDVMIKHSFNYHVDSFTAVSRVWDTISMAKYSVKQVPAWIDSFMPQLDSLGELGFWKSIHSKTGMIQFYTGPLFNLLLSEMDQSKKPGGLKLHVHGSHDISVCPVFWALSLREDFYPKPGDTVILELYKDDTIKFFLYSPLEEKESKRFQHISLYPLCEKDPCPLNVFKEKLSLLSFDESKWKAMCSKEWSGTDRPEPPLICNSNACP